MTQLNRSFVVADDPDLCESLAMLLERAGFGCRFFSSTREFLLDPLPKAGCVIAEIRMPETAGLDARGEVLRLFPQLVMDSRATEVKAAKERLAVLTPRETSVLAEVAKGNPNKVAARNLGISPRTVEVHRARIMAKLHASSVSELVRLAILSGMDGEPGH